MGKNFLWQIVRVKCVKELKLKIQATFLTKNIEQNDSITNFSVLCMVIDDDARLFYFLTFDACLSACSLIVTFSIFSSST